MDLLPFEEDTQGELVDYEEEASEILPAKQQDTERSAAECLYKHGRYAIEVGISNSWKYSGWTAGQHAEAEFAISASST